MDAITALLIIAVVYAIGDFVSQKTKAIFSMLSFPESYSW